MFISVLDLFKIGIGPSSSHTMGPMLAAGKFLKLVLPVLAMTQPSKLYTLRCTLRGSLAYTGLGHGTDKAIVLGLNGYTPENVAEQDIDELITKLWSHKLVSNYPRILFSPQQHIIFNKSEALPEHSNGMIFELFDSEDKVVISETYFSIGGGFIYTLSEITQSIAPLKITELDSSAYGFDSAQEMLEMSHESGLSIADMKLANELKRHKLDNLNQGMDAIWQVMKGCVEKGLSSSGILPGGLEVKRGAQSLYQQLTDQPEKANLNDWLCAYAMAVNEENAAGHKVVTAPTNGAAGVIPAVLYYFTQHEGGTQKDVRNFLLTASAIGGVIKHRSSISGAEVGCQGEVGSAAAMAAAGLCSVQGGTSQQIENAAEIALEHHLGMTCDPVKGLVQVPCIERNGFGAIKAYTAASLALRGNGQHFMPLDNCIAAMKQTGLEMSHKYKETSLGGLAVSIIEC